MTNRYIQLFSYLKDFVKLREQVIRTITRYDEVVFFDEVPQERGYSSVIWASVEAKDRDEWLRFKKPKTPEFPPIPTELEGWVDAERCTDPAWQPELPEQIERNGVIFSRATHPRIIALFEDYIVSRWIEWASLQTEYLRLNKIYRSLFRMYDYSTKFSEEYEVAVGIGFFQLKTKQGTRIGRHVLIANCAVDFYPDRQVFLVKVGEEGANLRFELDMVDDLSIGDVRKAEHAARIALAEEEVFERPFEDGVRRALASFVNSFHPDGSFTDSPIANDEYPLNPKISYAPAIFLRKRRASAFTTMVRSILHEIEEDPALRVPLLDEILAEDHEIARNQTESEDKDRREIRLRGAGKARFIDENVVYFPKKWNEQQVRILDKLQLGNRVLVQGPPGTGKSHTIANLICHLLATGSRILVTALTKRALAVLKGLLPDEIKPLCVNLLGNDRESIKDMERSISEINVTLNIFEEDETNNRIAELESRIKDRAEEIVQNETALSQHRINLSKPLEINGDYSGTPLEIAKTLTANDDQHGWLLDEVDGNEPIEKLAADLEKFISLKIALEKKSDVDYFMWIPCRDDIPSAADLRILIEVEHALGSCADPETDSLELPISIPSSCDELDAQEIDKIMIPLTDIRRAFADSADGGEQWQLSSLSDLIAGKSALWKGRIEAGTVLFNSFSEELVVSVQNIVRIEDTDSNASALLRHACVLLDFTRSGKKIDRPRIFLPKAIKTALSALLPVSVDGRPCDSVAGLEKVVDYLTLRLRLDDMAAAWDGELDESLDEGSTVVRFAEMNRIHQRLQRNFKTAGSATEFRQNISKEYDIRMTHMGLSTLDCLHTALARRKYTSLANQYVKRMNTFISLVDMRAVSMPKAHDKVGQLVGAIRSRDPSTFESQLRAIEEIRQNHELYEAYKVAQSVVSSKLPRTVAECESVLSTGGSKEHDSVIKSLKWAQANTVLNSFDDRSTSSQLEQAIVELRVGEAADIAEVASLRAWSYLMMRMTPPIRQHLTAWYQYVRKIGKGTGKNAPKFRRLARQEMGECRDAIPAWIMPLYRVAETIPPRIASFDYVIIDEASQLGPEAFLLTFLAKNIIVVGDDKQTSPEYIGVPNDLVNNLISEHLKGIPFADSYGKETSFFDHAHRFCAITGGRITLQEHFRCVPEIIAFSNKEFYEPLGCPLYPMRQYSEVRLEPLCSEHIVDAQVVMKGKQIRNPCEAERLVAALERCLQDPIYHGKTMGVISLQGLEQAKLIEQLLMDQIGPEEMERRNIICGNSASFQGDERDVIFLSMVVTPEYNFAALTRDSDDRRANVALSRARDQMFLFHSVSLDDIVNQQDLRYRIVEFFTHEREAAGPRERHTYAEKKNEASTTGVSAQLFESILEKDVHSFLSEHNVELIPQFPVGKYRIDFAVVLGSGRKVALECDGDYHLDDEHMLYDTGRQRDLERCGWEFFRVQGSDFYRNAQNALQDIIDLTNRYRAPATEPPTWEAQSARPIGDGGADKLDDERGSVVDTEEPVLSSSVALGEPQKAVPAIPIPGDRGDEPEGTFELLPEIEIPFFFKALRGNDWIKLAEYSRKTGVLYKWEQTILYDVARRITTHEHITPKILFELQRLYSSHVEMFNGFVGESSRATTNKPEIEMANGGEVGNGPFRIEDGSEIENEFEQDIDLGKEVHVPTGTAPVLASLNEIETQDELYRYLNTWYRGISSETWFSLAHQAKKQGDFTGFDRKFLFSMGTYASRGQNLSMKQLNLAKKLYEAGKDLLSGEK
jgi:very-short-patch-repair endonuclease